MTNSVGGFTFLDGWDMLPDELRLKVLSHVFESDHPIGHKEYAEVLDSTLFPLLLTAHDKMVTEALYAYNTVRVSSQTKLVPPGFHTLWVRRLVIEMPAATLFNFKWKFLEKMCHGFFRRLDRIDINISAKGDMDHFHYYTSKVKNPFDWPLIIPDVKELSVKFDFELRRPGEYYIEPSQGGPSFYPLLFQRISLREHMPKGASMPTDSVQHSYTDPLGKECTFAQLPVVGTVVSGGVLLNKYRVDKITMTRFQSE
jgi:hypothetical protein